MVEEVASAIVAGLGAEAEQGVFRFKDIRRLAKTLPN